MFKYLIFFTLILFIKNKFSDKEFEYLKNVYELTKSAPIISDFEEKFVL